MTRLRGRMNVRDDIDAHLFSGPGHGCGVRLGLSRADLVGRWGRCGAVANFLAGYLLDDPGGRALCSTVFNEIIENAAKYSAPGETAIEIRAWRAEAGAGIEARHLTEHAQVERLTEWIARFGDEDLDALIASAAAGSTGSRLGLLTLVRDYGARLSVRAAPWVGADRRDLAVRVELPCAPAELASSVPR